MNVVDTLWRDVYFPDLLQPRSGLVGCGAANRLAPVGPSRRLGLQDCSRHFETPCGAGEALLYAQMRAWHTFVRSGDVLCTFGEMSYFRTIHNRVGLHCPTPRGREAAQRQRLEPSRAGRADGPRALAACLACRALDLGVLRRVGDPAPRQPSAPFWRWRNRPKPCKHVR